MKAFIIWWTALGLVGFVSAERARAQSERPPTSQPSKNQTGTGDVVKDATSLEQRIDKLRVKCYLCKGTGRVKPEDAPVPLGEKPPTKVQRCWLCEGTGRRLEYQGALDAYVAYCDFAESHAQTLAEKQNKKIAERVAERRARFLNEIIGHDINHFVQWDIPFGDLARKLILGKSSPSGHAIAFVGQVVEVASENGKSIAKVIVTRWDRHRRTTISDDGSQTDCFVIVPDGVRWVAGAEVRVIGKVIDPSDFQALLKQNREAVLVKPYAGTE